MIGTQELQRQVLGYCKRCFTNHKEPTYNGLGTALNISGGTIKHIVTGYYKGSQAYTDTPHITRCIDNADFALIRALFDKQSE